MNTLKSVIFNKWSLSLALILIFLAYLVSSNLIDEELNPKAVDFFYKKYPDVPDYENAAYSVIGLTAPIIEQDIHSYGMNLVANAHKSYLTIGGMGITYPRIPLDESEISFVGDSGDLFCIIDPSILDKYPNFSCATEQGYKKMLEDNAVLLNRYISLFEYDKWRIIPSLSRNNQSLINLNRLLSAKIIDLSSNNQLNEALDLWLREIEFIRNATLQPKTWIGRAINMVISKGNLTTLNMLLQEKPEIALLYKHKLSSVLKPIAIAERDIPGILRSEFKLLNDSFCHIIALLYKHKLSSVLKPIAIAERDIPGILRSEFKLLNDSFCHISVTSDDNDQKCFTTMHNWTFRPNRTLNNMYAYSEIFLKMANTPLIKLQSECDKFGSTYEINYSYLNQALSLFNWTGDRFYNLFVSPRTCELIESMHDHNALMLFLSTYVDIISQKLTGDAISAYLDSRPKDKLNPITNAPFEFNKSTYEISFTDLSEYEWKLAIEKHDISVINGTVR